jgi:hypothetical protein
MSEGLKRHKFDGLRDSILFNFDKLRYRWRVIDGLRSALEGEFVLAWPYRSASVKRTDA